MVKSCPMKFGLTCYVAKKRDMLIKLFQTFEAVPSLTKHDSLKWKILNRHVHFLLCYFKQIQKKNYDNSINKTFDQIKNQNKSTKTNKSNWNTNK